MPKTERKLKNQIFNVIYTNFVIFVNLEPKNGLKLDIPDLVNPLSFPHDLISQWNLHV